MDAGRLGIPLGDRPTESWTRSSRTSARSARSAVDQAAADESAEPGRPGGRKRRSADSRRRSAADAARHRGPPPRPARRAAARRGVADPRAPGLRLPRAGGPRPLRRARSTASERPCSTRCPGASPTRSRAMKPEDLAAKRDMVRDLNRLLDRAARGPTSPSSGPWTTSCAGTAASSRAPRTLDDVIDAARGAHGGDPVAAPLADARAARRAPGHDRRAAPRRPPALGPRPARGEPRPAPARRPRRAACRSAGDEPLGLEWRSSSSGASRPLDTLEAPARGVERPGDLAGIDRVRVRDLLGADAARDLDALDDLARTARAAGYLERRGDRLELTRAAAGGSARRSSTTCSRGSAATRSAATGSSAPGGAASARRRPSHTSSATRSTSTCARR